ncbi:hypothetical protein [Sphingobium xenophagum]|uniref:hypothetical protein n=1 Tax=Sphingobium xenophagum TaxID=121428 RepID=UPI0036D33DAE|tara:strand:- start:428 stop:3337 length:2910 start_codon:yes stop_codon:yes gene_type:complete
MQTMPWDEDWSQAQAGAGAGGYPIITTPRDPRQVAREDRTETRAERDQRLQEEAAARDRDRFNERNKPTLPAGYAWGPDGKTAVRISGLPPEAGATPPQSDSDLATVRAEAIDKIKLARSLQLRSRDGWFATGFGSGIAGSINGTGAHDVAQDTETLKNAGALTRIMEMAKANGGKNPLTPLSNSDFQALASSLSNLETGQSDEQYQRNVQRVIDLYTRAYQGAGGKDLEGDIDPAKKKRSEAVLPSIATPQGRDIDPAGGNPLLSPDDRDFLSKNARYMTPDSMRKWHADRNLSITPENAKEIYAYYQKGGQQDAAVNVPQGEGSAWGKFAASPVGTGMYAAVDAGMGGMTDEFASMAGGGDLADLNARKQAAFAANPASSFAGQTIGTIGSMAALGGLSRGAGVASRFSNPQLFGDMAFGAASGAGQNNDNRLAGATLGATGGFVGNRVGDMASRGIGAIARTQPGLAVTNRARGFFGRLPISRADPLSSAEGTALGALNRSGIDDVRSSLTEASDLDIPMALADTNSNLRELAGAAVRRSPSASAYAENALIPRNRAQYDRFTAAVERDLGPTANIPQLSADMMTQARSAASDLYDAAYRRTIPSTPELDGTLATPFGRQALSRARTIAANERRDPQAMGFRLDAEGNVVLEPGQPMSLTGAGRDGGMPMQQPAYTTQTLDYVKRGMDDVLEEKRNPITGRLVLDEAGRAQNGVRGQLLSEVDRLNPDYAAARAAYAGPMASRDALARGGDAYSLHPHELAMQVGNQTPEHLSQMQLGYRGALVDHAGRVRDNSNPWEATLGSPVARDRLSSIYPATPGVDRMLRSRELEGSMQQTTNAILGNSRTARNQIADQSFLENPMVEGALHAGAALATNGASVPGTAARIVSAGLKNRLALGMGKRAEAKADALAPILLNPNPTMGLSAIDDIIARDQAYRAFIEASRPKALRMFGAGVGSQAATAPLNY